MSGPPTHPSSDLVTCPCCGIPHETLRQSMFVSEPVCSDCLAVWYDEVVPRCNQNDYARDIRHASRLRQGFTMEVYEP